MTRIGKKFASGFPYIAGSGILYDWPTESKGEYDLLFAERKEVIGGYLLARAKRYLPTPVGRAVMYPRLKHGPKTETINVDTDCACISFGSSDFGSFVNFHNVDAWAHRAIGFNLSADLLEHLDHEVLAPRINLDEPESVIDYPFPAEAKLLTLDEKQVGLLRKLGSDLGELRVEATDALQRLVFPKGRVDVAREGCKAYAFKGYDLIRATQLMAHVSDRCTQS